MRAVQTFDAPGGPPKQGKVMQPAAPDHTAQAEDDVLRVLHGSMKMLAPFAAEHGAALVAARVKVFEARDALAKVRAAIDEARGVIERLRPGRDALVAQAATGAEVDAGMVVEVERAMGDAEAVVTLYTAALPAALAALAAAQVVQATVVGGYIARRRDDVFARQTELDRLAYEARAAASEHSTAAGIAARFTFGDAAAVDRLLG